MKLQLASDLHLECHKDNGKEFLNVFKNAGADVLILAGDIIPAKMKPELKHVLDYVSDHWEKVIYVAGNHEFYGSEHWYALDTLQDTCDYYSNISFLDNRSITINGVKFFGGTSWFHEPPQTEHTKKLKSYMSDFSLIKGLIPSIYESNQAFADGLEVNKPDVVISHHLPTSACVTQQYKTSPLNIFFVSDQDVENCGAKLWLFGHTHSQVDLMVGKTRCVANPFGYPNELKSQLAFNDSLILEV